jgi:GNAT superfamily N-acetyltransferase
MEVKEISAEDTYPIRHQMLREGRPIETAHFDGDHDESTFHLGGFIDGSLVSVTSFFYRKSQQIPGEHHYQLRGMATLPDYQGKGLSSALVQRAIPTIKNNHCSHIWCNARVASQGFYSKIGFRPLGAEFAIDPIGPHVLMVYQL